MNNPIWLPITGAENEEDSDSDTDTEDKGKHTHLCIIWTQIIYNFM